MKETTPQRDDSDQVSPTLSARRRGMPIPLLTRPLDRRQMLRGLLGGASVALGLPLLEAHHHRARAQDSGFPRRFGVFYWGNGNLPASWSPAGMGDATSPWRASDQLAPLEPWAGQTTVVTGLNINVPNLLPHFSGLVGSLGGAPATIVGEDYTFPDMSVDQVVAEAWAGQTRFRSLEIAVAERYPISFLGPHQPLTPETSPLALYQRVFSDEFRAPGEEAVLDPRIALRRSVLDAVLEDQRALMSRLGVSDQQRLEQHMESVRALELQLSRLAEDPPSFAGCRRPEVPVDPDEADGRGRLKLTHRAFSNLLALALACDQTRVFSEALTRPVGNYLFPTSSAGHHRLTHDEPGDQPEVKAVVIQIMQQLAYLTEALHAVPEGEGTLLDHTYLVATSEISLGRSHSLENVPFMIIGGGGERLKSGVHYHSAGGESTSAAWLSVMRALGLRQAEWGRETQRVTDGLSVLEV